MAICYPTHIESLVPIFRLFGESLGYSENLQGTLRIFTVLLESSWYFQSAYDISKVLVYYSSFEEGNYF